MSAALTTNTASEALRAPALANELGARLGLRRRAAWALSCLAVDVSMLTAAGFAARLGAGAAGVSSSATGWTVLFALGALAIFAVRGLYAPRLRLDVVEDARSVVTALTLAGVSVLALQAVLGANSAPADVVRPWLFAAVYVTAGRAALGWLQAHARRAGEGCAPTLIVGAGRVGRLTAKRLLEHPELGLRPVGYLDKEPLAGGDDGAGLPVLGASWDLDRVIAEHGIEQVIVTFSTAPHEVLVRFVNRCEELGVRVALVPRLYEKTTTRLAVEHIGGLPLLSARATDGKDFQFAVKYAVDRVVAAVALIFAAPILAGAALAVYVSMGRPIFFRQVRVGRDGKAFEILKFRSMKQAAPGTTAALALADGSAPGGVEGEDRRTRVGTFLRKSSVDELPQLFNVLRGDMSLVGPRPERPEFVDAFTRSVYRYGDRHRVKSGITGWAQVNGLRGKTSIADRAEWDNHYIENFSLWLDLKIVVLTVLAVFSVFRSVE
jgi:exopolysaccharide biosynthesis polyprenyl glycosylphosphotransferase